MSDARRRGRPTRAAVAADKRLEVRLTPGERADLERVATENGTSMADLAREAINEYVADYGDRQVFVR
jgi:predicted HicB family RNase H-like nuclease